MAAEYKIVSAKSAAELETAVTSEISGGLAPQGGIGIDTRTLDPTFYQVMYKAS